MNLVFIPILTVMQQGAAAMQEIRSTGALSGAETEEKLNGVLEQYTENFLNTRPEK